MERYKTRKNLSHNWDIYIRVHHLKFQVLLKKGSKSQRQWTSRRKQYFWIQHYCFSHELQVFIAAFIVIVKADTILVYGERDKERRKTNQSLRILILKLKPVKETLYLELSQGKKYALALLEQKSSKAPGKESLALIQSPLCC